MGNTQVQVPVPAVLTQPVLGRGLGISIYERRDSTCLEIERDPETSVLGTPAQSEKAYGPLRRMKMHQAKQNAQNYNGNQLHGNAVIEFLKIMIH